MNQNKGIGNSNATGANEIRTVRPWGRQVGEEMQQCIDNCLNCHAVCLETVMRVGGQHAEAAHVRLLLDCAQICATSADFMLRQSDLHGRTCGVCAEVCTRCADECEKMGDDEQMRACAQMCRQCAASCSRMAQMV